MASRWISVALLSTKVALGAPDAALPPSATPSPAPSVAARLAEADTLYRTRNDPGNAQRALGIYRGLYAESRDSNTSWRLAMACYFVGLRQITSRSEKAAIFEEGKSAGMSGAAANDHCVECHFWGAINLALYAEAVGVFNTLFALGEIREHLKKSLDLDPAYANGGAYRLLGLIEQKLPGILGGDNSRARDYFHKALAVAPEEPLNYLFLAKLEREEFRDAGEAQRLIKQGLAVPTPTSERLESIESLAELRQLNAQAR